MNVPVIVAVTLLLTCSAAPVRDKDEDYSSLNEPEQSGLFEGDVAESWLSKRRLHKRNIGIGINRWSGGTVFYTIDDRYDEESRVAIENALRKFEDITEVGLQKCIQFVARTHQENYVYITPEQDACYSRLGMSGGRQVTSLGPKCLKKSGKIIHEMMHVLGFLHEQSRFDRDEYVTVIWENIKADQDVNFEKYDPGLADTMALPYDYRSLMHYSSKAFSKNGSVTMTATRTENGEDYTTIMGQRDALSELDVTRVRKAYGCPVEAPSNQTATY